MNKANFKRKALRDEVIPVDKFIIEKVIELPINEFNIFLDDMLDDYDFIKNNQDLMYVDSDQVWHSIYVTAKEVNYGILVQSSGYGYARYSAFLRKRYVFQEELNNDR